MIKERPRNLTRPSAAGRPASTAGMISEPARLLARSARLATLAAVGVLAVACGQGGSGGIVDVGYEASSPEVPSDPLPIDPETRTCWDGQPEVGCPNLPAPIDSVVEITPGVLATYVDSAVSVESNPDYPLAATARMGRVQVSLAGPPVDLGSASGSYTTGDISVAESASPHSPEAVVEALREPPPIDLRHPANH